MIVLLYVDILNSMRERAPLYCHMWKDIQSNVDFYQKEIICSHCTMKLLTRENSTFVPWTHHCVRIAYCKWMNCQNTFYNTFNTSHWVDTFLQSVPMGIEPPTLAVLMPRSTRHIGTLIKKQKTVKTFSMEIVYFTHRTI